jgi:hypothetical protein
MALAPRPTRPPGKTSCASREKVGRTTLVVRPANRPLVGSFPSRRVASADVDKMPESRVTAGQKSQ